MKVRSKLGRSFWIASMTFAVLLAGWLVAYRHALTADHLEARHRDLGLTLGARIGALVSSGEVDRIKAALHDWVLNHQATAIRVTTTEGRVIFSEGNWENPTAFTEVAVLHNGSPWGTVRLARMDGHGVVWIELFSVRYWPAWVAATVILLFVVSRMVARRGSGMAKAWQETRDRVQSTLDFLAECVLVADPNGKLIFANAPFRTLLGEEIARVHTLGDLPWQADGSPIPWWVIDGAVHTVVLDGPVHGRRAFLARSTPIRDGSKSFGRLITLNDVTEIENNRRELTLAKAAADGANQAKGLFLANMSHEIRTPINGVMGSLELLGRTELSTAQCRYLDAAQVSASSLLHLINDIIDLSRIEAGNIELENISFDLDDCLTGALKVVTETAAAKGLELTLHYEQCVPSTVQGDSGRLRQILLNLVSNAVKFTSKGGVHVHVHSDSVDHATLRLNVQVTDTGIGIPPSRLDRLFKVFSQVDASTVRRYGGSGLGLAICRQLCDMMKGSITVTSQPGSGSTFSFDVQLHRASIQCASLLPSPRICAVVDQRERSRSMLEDLCKRIGFQTISCSQLESVQSGLASARPLVLLGATAFGREEAAAVRTLKQLPARPLIIAALSRDVTPDIERTHESFVDGWLRTPASASGLLSIIESVEHGNTARAAAQPEPAVVRRAVRVLIAEDHPITQMITSEAVAAAGFDYEIASTGEEALAAALSGRFGLALMDYHLPDVDGLEITRRVRAHELQTGADRLVVIALTASAMSEDRERCLQAGVDRYMSKPINRGQLIELLQDLCPAAAPCEVSPHAVRTNAPCVSQGVDVAGLTERCLGKPAIVLKLLSLFVSTTQDDLVKLESAVAQSASTAVHDLAHRIAGGALQINAAELATAARALESAPNDSGGLPAIQRAFAVVKRDVENYRETQASVSRDAA